MTVAVGVLVTMAAKFRVPLAITVADTGSTATATWFVGAMSTTMTTSLVPGRVTQMSPSGPRTRAAGRPPEAGRG